MSIGLGDIATGILQGVYNDSILAFYRDVVGVLTDAMSYAPETSPLCQTGLKLCCVFERMFLEGILHIEKPLESTSLCPFCRLYDDDGSGIERKGVLCDRCDGPFHLECARPPLQVAPRGEWFCQYCISQRSALDFHPFNNLLVLHPTSGRRGRVVSVKRKTSLDILIYGSTPTVLFIVEFPPVSESQIVYKSMIRETWTSQQCKENANVAIPDLPTGYTYDELDILCGLCQGYEGWGWSWRGFCDWMVRVDNNKLVSLGVGGAAMMRRFDGPFNNALNLLDGESTGAAEWVEILDAVVWKTMGTSAMLDTATRKDEECTNTTMVKPDTYLSALDEYTRNRLDVRIGDTIELIQNEPVDRIDEDNLGASTMEPRRISRKRKMLDENGDEVDADIELAKLEESMLSEGVDIDDPGGDDESEDEHEFDDGDMDIDDMSGDGAGDDEDDGAGDDDVGDVLSEQSEDWEDFIESYERKRSKSIDSNTTDPYSYEEELESRHTVYGASLEELFSISEQMEREKEIEFQKKRESMELESGSSFLAFSDTNCLENANPSSMDDYNDLSAMDTNSPQDRILLRDHIYNNNSIPFQFDWLTKWMSRRKGREDALLTAALLCELTPLIRLDEDVDDEIAAQLGTFNASNLILKMCTPRPADGMDPFEWLEAWRVKLRNCTGNYYGIFGLLSSDATGVLGAPGVPSASTELLCNYCGFGESMLMSQFVCGQTLKEWLAAELIAMESDPGGVATSLKRKEAGYKDATVTTNAFSGHTSITSENNNEGFIEGTSSLIPSNINLTSGGVWLPLSPAIGSVEQSKCVAEKRPFRCGSLCVHECCAELLTNSRSGVFSRLWSSRHERVMEALLCIGRGKTFPMGTDEEGNSYWYFAGCSSIFVSTRISREVSDNKRSYVTRRFSHVASCKMRFEAIEEAEKVKDTILNIHKRFEEESCESIWRIYNGLSEVRLLYDWLDISRPSEVLIRNVLKFLFPDIDKGDSNVSKSQYSNGILNEINNKNVMDGISDSIKNEIESNHENINILITNDVIESKSEDKAADGGGGTASMDCTIDSKPEDQLEDFEELKSTDELGANAGTRSMFTRSRRSTSDQKKDTNEKDTSDQMLKAEVLLAEDDDDDDFVPRKSNNKRKRVIEDDDLDVDDAVEDDDISDYEFELNHTSLTELIDEADQWSGLQHVFELNDNVLVLDGCEKDTRGVFWNAIIKGRKIVTLPNNNSVSTPLRPSYKYLVKFVGWSDCGKKWVDENQVYLRTRSSLQHQELCRRRFVRQQVLKVPEELRSLYASRFLSKPGRHRSLNALGQTVSTNPLCFTYARDPLGLLKAGMFMVEASLPYGSIEDSDDRWGDNFVIIWRAAVNAAFNAETLMECQVMLEYGVRTSWFHSYGAKLLTCMPSRLHSLRNATYGLIAMRLWALDQAIRYDKVVYPNDEKNNALGTGKKGSKGSSKQSITTTSLSNKSLNSSNNTYASARSLKSKKRK